MPTFQPTVGNEADLNADIAFLNAQTAGRFTITLAANALVLIASPGVFN